MGRESFVVYHSYLKAIEPLNDAERGRLFTACLEYSMTGKEPELRGNERFIFPSWQSQIDRDYEKYEDTCKKRSESAKKRWDMQEHANACKSTVCIANDAEDDNEDDDENENEGQGNMAANHNRKIAEDTIAYLNLTANKRYKLTDSYFSHINARIKEGASREDFERVIDIKVAEWNRVPEQGQRDMRKYLRPDTLFGTKFQGYLNEPFDESVLDEMPTQQKIVAGGRVIQE